MVILPKNYLPQIIRRGILWALLILCSCGNEEDGPSDEAKYFQLNLTPSSEVNSIFPDFWQAVEGKYYPDTMYSPLRITRSKISMKSSMNAYVNISFTPQTIDGNIRISGNMLTIVSYDFIPDFRFMELSRSLYPPYKPNNNKDDAEIEIRGFLKDFGGNILFALENSSHFQNTEDTLFVSKFNYIKNLKGGEKLNNNEDLKLELEIPLLSDYTDSQEKKETGYISITGYYQSGSDDAGVPEMSIDQATYIFPIEPVNRILIRAAELEKYLESCRGDVKYFIIHLYQRGNSDSRMIDIRDSEGEVYRRIYGQGISEHEIYVYLN